MPELVFEDYLPLELKKSAEDIFKVDLKIVQKFQSADSYSYLLESEKNKYVGKIFRFEYWPPMGKLEYVHDLLSTHHIPHEEILHSAHNHPVFKYGWQLSRYIPGGTVKDLKNKKLWNNKEYLIKLGMLLKQVHQIKFDYFGSLHEKENRFDSFKQLATAELEEQDFNGLPPEYLWAQQLIDQAKELVLENLNNFKWTNSTLVHDDANNGNVMWQNSNPILIDWVDSLAGPPLRDFASITYRFNESILAILEEGYGKRINQAELRLHQIMRFIRLGKFFYFEYKDIDEFHKMMNRLKVLLQSSKPYGA